MSFSILVFSQLCIHVLHGYYNNTYTDFILWHSFSTLFSLLFNNCSFVFIPVGVLIILTLCVRCNIFACICAPKSKMLKLERSQQCRNCNLLSGKEDWDGLCMSCGWFVVNCRNNSHALGGEYYKTKAGNHHKTKFKGNWHVLGRSTRAICWQKRLVCSTWAEAMTSELCQQWITQGCVLTATTNTHLNSVAILPRAPCFWCAGVSSQSPGQVRISRSHE